MRFLWVALGSAVGGVCRYALGLVTLPISSEFPWGTVLINVLGCLVIGFFGTFTLPSGRFAASENARLFVMVGLCGGFTTFSSFSLQSFDLLRSGGLYRALLNIVLSVVLCLLAVAAGHLLAHHSVQRFAVAQTRQEEVSS